MAHLPSVGYWSMTVLPEYGRPSNIFQVIKNGVSWATMVLIPDAERPKT